MLIITNLRLRSRRFTCRRVPLRDLHWAPNSSTPLSSCMFEGQEDPRCIEPGICRVVWRRLPLRESTGKENERKQTSAQYPCVHVNDHSIWCNHSGRKGPGNEVYIWCEMSWLHQQATRYQVPLRVPPSKDYPKKKSTQLRNVPIRSLNSTSQPFSSPFNNHTFIRALFISTKQLVRNEKCFPKTICFPNTTG